MPVEDCLRPPWERGRLARAGCARSRLGSRIKWIHRGPLYVAASLCGRSAPLESIG